MNEKFQYKLSTNQKNEIAQNLIDILQKNIDITDQTRGFICNWILTVSDEKRKAFFDVWDIVLKSYLPPTRPILFRACKRFSKNSRIASFTANLDCAKRFSNGKGLLIICDTSETLQFEEEFYANGNYRNTFYPLVDVLIKARDSGGWGFSERILGEYIGEGEYIMRINLENVNTFRWV
ncbi:MAG: hypothetical protein ABIP27_04505 [Flavobacterium circumlabens]|uniref:hypothetical protein n=1 Tax=Flavobacterium circumlabens TaxID=2133765 RepID=UPI0032635B2D